MFQIIYSVVCRLDLFLYNFLLFLKMICALNEIVVLVDAFFEAFQTIREKRFGFVVAEICAAEGADQR